MFLLGAEGGRFLELVKNVVTLDFILYGLNVELDKCIQCTKCIRFMRVVLGTGNIGIIGRGMKLKIGGYVLCGLMHIYSGNINDVCPVGKFKKIDKSVLFCSYSWVKNKVIFVYYKKV